MKFQLYIFICLFFYLSKCVEVILPTNYTLSYFKNIDMSKMTCKTDKDCPEFSTCGSFKSKENEKTISVCRFGNFLCQGNNNYFSKDNDNCVYVNTTIWNMDKQEMNKGFDKKLKPILKTCPNPTINNDNKNYNYFSNNNNKKKKSGTSTTEDYCFTEKCTKDEDCISGLCYNGSCRTNFIIYRCSGESSDDNDEYLKCGKDISVVCESNEDCFTGYCSKHICQYKLTWSDALLLIGILIIILIIIALCGCCIRKYIG
ncbi:hypothetical protein BCR32DRAFT_272869 [Anaeromyces robustus]|uniref:Chitin-binding type-2 domain-containing protein n=1 Tax=Anaeromyces robustus TaxID=1754192 RepID=A0A1Y1VUR2_9FUNG|nr:hypothetical protein BCR32DRAFT_272869 [Anaeromyces robustus]|eukprot:ORX65029.1 hypothetical protein BCR32DRAFT_272869 [Anaeromyces robustus]